MQIYRKIERARRGATGYWLSLTCKHTVHRKEYRQRCRCYRCEWLRDIHPRASVERLLIPKDHVERQVWNPMTGFPIIDIIPENETTADIGSEIAPVPLR